MALRDYVFIPQCHPIKDDGLPHSDTPGSKPVDGSPRIIAVFRVLHSLLMPRHPSCARIRLARNFFELSPISSTLYFSLIFQLPVFKDRARPFRGEQVRSIPYPPHSAQGGQYHFAALSHLSACIGRISKKNHWNNIRFLARPNLEEPAISLLAQRNDEDCVVAVFLCKLHFG